MMGGLGLTMGVQKPEFICGHCAMEYHRFTHEHLMSRDWSGGLSHDEEMAAVQQFVDTADGHMKEWILRGGSRDAV
jgi:hypothetical protein